MSPELIAILAVGVSVLAFLGRLRVRLTAIEKETVRLSGLAWNKSQSIDLYVKDFLSMDCSLRVSAAGPL